MKPVLIAVLLFMALPGCQSENSPPPSEVVTLKRTARFQVVRVAKFEDRLAYGSERGIYVIRDSVTGKEYVGVSGVGISELGEHSERSNKHTHTVSDER